MCALVSILIFLSFGIILFNSLYKIAIFTVGCACLKCESSSAVISLIIDVSVTSSIDFLSYVIKPSPPAQ